ncbi:MAG TPA: hypothetical protein DCM05_11035 [Elusimicrobia bacterium]|nr:hypothetical protein [Elusimicrobiota bacterium]
MRTLLLLLACAVPALGAEEGVVLVSKTAALSPVIMPAYDRDTGRTGNIGEVRCLDFSPDGMFLFAASYQKKLIDVAAGTFPRDLSCGPCRIPYTTSNYNTGAFSRDGTKVLVGEYDVLRLWDTTGESALLFEQKSPGTLRSLSWSTDGQSVAIGDYDGYVFLLDLASGKKKELLKGDRKRGSWSPVQVAFGADPSLPSEHWIFAASEKGGLVAIDPSGRRGPKTLTAVREQASDPVLSPDGLYLAAVVDKTVRLWMTVTLREVKRFEYADKTPGNLSYGGNRLAFSLYHPDGRRLVVIEPESGVRLLDIPFQHPITSLALSRDGTMLAVGTQDEQVHYWRNLDLLIAFSPMEFKAASKPGGAREAETLYQELESKLATMSLPEKGEFETTTEHEARVKTAKDTQARLREEYEAKIRAALGKQAAADDAVEAKRKEELASFNRRIGPLRAADHLLTLQTKLGAYDADQEAFQVEALGASLKARAPREKAKALDRGASYLLKVRLRRQDEDFRLVSAVLLDPKTREPLSPDEDVPAAKPAAQAAPPKLELAAVSFEDGSADGVLEAGETGKVKVRLRNSGKGEAYGVNLKLESQAQGLSFKERTYVGTVKPGEEKTVEAALAAEAIAAEDEAALRVLLAESEGFDSQPLVLKFKTRPLRLPKLELAGIEIKDAEGNRTLAKGREGEVTLVVRNAGRGAARKVKARLSSKDEQVKIYGESEADLGALAPGESKRAVFSVAVTRRYAGPNALPLSLTLSEERPECAAAPELGVVLGVESSDIKVVRVAALETGSAKAEASIDDVPAIKTPAFGPDDFGVVVGIERYRDLPRSEFSSRDAKLFKEYLKALGVPERNIELLIDDRATKTSLERTLGTWLRSRVKPSSRVVVYYSGHGAPEPATGEAYLVPFDGEAEFLSDTAYPLERLKQRLGNLPASEVLVVLDSCFSGAGGRSVLAKGARPLVVTKAAGALPANMAILSASQGSQISTSSPQKRHGLLTYHLLKAVQDGSPDLASAYQALKPKVEDDAKLSSNASQTPGLQPPPETLSGRFLLRR